MSAPRSGSSSRPPNRLAGSSSPYLLQHAHNPVDWYPWGEEAFAEARRRDVPIFLSIGYSTCYWCHVMERESFEDDATAKLMNERMVCVKLDREERPDLDDIYMAATVAMTGQGGWPMSVFLEPDSLRPFFCGTYYPKEPMHGRPTFTRVVEGITDAYRSQRDDVRTQAARLAEAVTEQLATPTPPAPLNEATVEDALARILAMFDPVHGGFGGAPKFPQCVFLEFLLDVRDIADGETRAAIDHCVKTTLDAMAMGGIHDHLGGGFHRYSVDATWTVPHFEKMLYDQAQMLSVYSRGRDIYADAWWGMIASRAHQYVREELSSTGGGFFSAQDAEVGGREGLNYLWTPAQVREALSPDHADLIIHAYGLDRPANFRDPHHPSDPSAWVLRLTERWGALAAQSGLSDGDFNVRLLTALISLHTTRTKRPSPATDTKIIACWNGLMYAAIVRSTLVQNTLADELSDDIMEYGEPPARLVGETTPQRLYQVLQSLTAPDDSLLRTTGTPAFLEDYAAIASACIAAAAVNVLGELTEGGALLHHARRLIEDAIARFTIREGASLRIFDAPTSPDLFVRACSTHDGAMPCGYSLFLHALLDLAEVSDEPEAARLRTTAAELLRSMSGRIAESPVGSINSVRALLRLLRAAPELARTLADAPHNPPVGDPAVAVVSSGTVVEVLALDERITLAEGAPAQLTLRVRVKPGWHIIAADPGPHALPSLVPFRIGIFNGAGVVAYADYPAGVPQQASPNAPRTHSGDFDLTVALEREGTWNGTPLLFAQFQACSDTECLAPARVELDISLERA